MTKQQVKQHYPQIKEMYLGGVTINEISQKLKISKNAIYNAVSNMYLPRRQRGNELDLVYADNSPPILEKMIIDGKQYTDITPMFAPR